MNVELFKYFSYMYLQSHRKVWSNMNVEPLHQQMRCIQDHIQKPIMRTWCANYFKESQLGHWIHPINVITIIVPSISDITETTLLNFHCVVGAH